jgi:hypothetical protein
MRRFIQKITSIRTIWTLLSTGFITLALWLLKELGEYMAFQILIDASTSQTILKWLIANPYIIILSPISIGVAVVLISACIEIWNEQRNLRKLLSTSLIKIHERMLAFADRRINQFMTWGDWHEIIKHAMVATRVVDSAIDYKALETIMFEGIGINDLYEPINEDQASLAFSIFLTSTNELNDPVSVSAADHVLDTYHRSLFKLRDKDRSFKQLSETIRSIKLYFADSQLNALIDDYIGQSYRGSILLLFRGLIDKLWPEGLVLTEFVQSPTYDFTIKLNKEIDDLLQQIARRVDVLLNLKQEQSKRK